MNTDDPKLTKLPQWAQQHIHTLRQNVTYWKEKALAAAGETTSNTNLVVYNELPNGNPLRGLPPFSTVRFQLGKKRFGIEACIDNITQDVGVKEQSVCVRGIDTGIIVVPTASNVVRIFPTPW